MPVPAALLLVARAACLPMVAGGLQTLAACEEPGQESVVASRHSPSGVLAVPDGAQAVEVARHVDGDTLRVRTVGPGLLPGGREVVVRLLEIDAPETWAGPECFGERASAELARLLPVGSRAFVEPDRELRDAYGRHLRYAWTAHGILVNEAMVRRGSATAMLVEPNDAHIERLRRAEAAAREAGRGLWGSCG